MPQVNHLINKEGDARDSWNDQPSSIKGKPCKIKGHFFTIVACNKIKGLHGGPNVSLDEMPKKTNSVTSPTLFYLIFEVVMHSKMFNYDPYFFIAINLYII